MVGVLAVTLGSEGHNASYSGAWLQLHGHGLLYLFNRFVVFHESISVEFEGLD